MSDFASDLDCFAAVYEKCGMPPDKARDLIILRCLQDGDVSALSYFLLLGHVPGEEVLRTVGFMTCDSPKADSLVPFKMVTKSRGKGKSGPRVSARIAMRDELLALNVKAEFKEPGQYDAAIQAVVDRIGDQKKHQTVRNAFDALLGRRQGN